MEHSGVIYLFLLIDYLSIHSGLFIGDKKNKYHSVIMPEAHYFGVSKKIKKHRTNRLKEKELKFSF